MRAAKLGQSRPEAAKSAIAMARIKA